MGKMIGFRPSEKNEEAINLLVKEKKAKNKSDAVNKLIERGRDSPQLEHPAQDRREFFDLPICFLCPLTKGWVLAGELLSPKGCKDCLERRKCPAWNRNKSVPFSLPTSKSRSYREAHTVRY